jgi:hypothetical protein
MMILVRSEGKNLTKYVKTNWKKNHGALLTNIKFLMNIPCSLMGRLNYLKDNHSTQHDSMKITIGFSIELDK